MEGKEFHIDVGIQKGAFRGVIEERSKRFSPLIRLAPASLGFVLEGLERIFQVTQEEQWQPSWKEEGRIFLIVKEAYKVGPFDSKGLSR